MSDNASSKRELRSSARHGCASLCRAALWALDMDESSASQLFLCEYSCAVSSTAIVEGHLVV